MCKGHGSMYPCSCHASPAPRSCPALASASLFHPSSPLLPNLPFAVLAAHCGRPSGDCALCRRPFRALARRAPACTLLQLHRCAACWDAVARHRPYAALYFHGPHASVCMAADPWLHSSPLLRPFAARYLMNQPLPSFLKLPPHARASKARSVPLHCCLQRAKACWSARPLWGGPAACVTVHVERAATSPAWQRLLHLPVWKATAMPPARGSNSSRF